MLIRLSSLKTYARSLKNQNSIKRQLNTSMLYTHKNTYSFFEDPDSQTFKKYLNNSQDQIKNYTSGNFKFQRVIVPRNYIQSQQFANRLITDWKNKKIVLNIDSSALLGSKRFFMKNHLQQNVYKGLSQPDSIFCSKNPGVQLAVQQLKFDQRHFFSEDKAAKQIFKTIQDMPQQERQKIILQKLDEIYQNQPERFAQRLKKQLNVPQQYCSIIQMGTYNQNQIYFCGINEYAFRNLLSKYLKLADVQKLFMLSLKFAEIQSSKYKIRNIQSYNGKIQQRYCIFARQFIYLKHYKIIKRVQNGELVKRLSFISNRSLNPQNQDKIIKQQPDEQIKQKVQRMGRKSRRNLKSSVANKNNIVVFAHEYTLQTIQNFVLIKDLLSNSDYQQVPSFSQNSQNSPTPLSKVKHAGKKETDSQNIQKHAILQVMLGNLWSKHYTFNKFPYLSEDYNKLSQQDKKQVKKLFHQHLVKYTGVKQIYYQKNINKIDNIKENSQQFINMKREYQKKRQQEQKDKEQIKKKMQQYVDKQNKKKKKLAQKQENTQHQYQQSYEQQFKQQVNGQKRKKTKKQQLMQRDMKRIKQLTKSFQQKTIGQQSAQQILSKQVSRKKRRPRKYEKTQAQGQKQQDEIKQ